MRVERAKPKSRRDDEKVGQDKRSAVLDYGSKMITFLFSRFGLAGRRLRLRCAPAGVALAYFPAAPAWAPQARDLARLAPWLGPSASNIPERSIRSIT
jgi:hypothetical protein